jgi:hypothetical protein
MKKLLLNWIIAIAMTAAAFAMGHFMEMRYLKAKYPSIYPYETTTNPKLDYVYDVNTGKFRPTPGDENYNPEAHERYAGERNFLTFGIMLSSVILAVGTLRSVSNTKADKDA